MDIEQFLLTLVATVVGSIVGGSVVIFTNWIAAQGERRKIAQEWYEQTYLTEGLDPLILYCKSVSLLLETKDTKIAQSLRLTELDPYPIKSLVRVEVLYGGSGVFESIVAYALASLDENFSESDRRTRSFFLSEISALLLEWRRELLKVLETKVSRKTYQIDTTHIEHKLNAVIDKFSKQLS